MMFGVFGVETVESEFKMYEHVIGIITINPFNPTYLFSLIKNKIENVLSIERVN